MNLASLIFLPVGALLMLLALPMIRRKVPPNGLYGLRVSATLNNETVWYEANAVAGSDLMLIGCTIVVSSFVLPLGGLALETQALTQAALLLFGGLALAARGVILANRLEKKYGDSGRMGA